MSDTIENNNAANGEQIDNQGSQQALTIEEIANIASAAPPPAAVATQETPTNDDNDLLELNSEVFEKPRSMDYSIFKGTILSDDDLADIDDEKFVQKTTSKFNSLNEELEVLKVGLEGKQSIENNPQYQSIKDLLRLDNENLYKQSLLAKGATQSEAAEMWELKMDNEKGAKEVEIECNMLKNAAKNHLRSLEEDSIKKAQETYKNLKTNQAVIYEKAAEILAKSDTIGDFKLPTDKVQRQRYTDTVIQNLKNGNFVKDVLQDPKKLQELAFEYYNKELLRKSYFSKGQKAGINKQSPEPTIKVSSSSATQRKPAETTADLIAQTWGNKM